MGKSDFTARERSMVLNCYHWMQAHIDPATVRRSSVDLTVDCLGPDAVSKATVYRFVKEDQEGVPLVQDANRSIKRSRVNSVNRREWGYEMHFIVYDLHLYVLRLFQMGEYPSLEKMLRFCLMSYRDIPDISIRTFGRFLKIHNFRFRAANNLDFYINRPDVVEDRRKFIAQYIRYRDAGYELVFGDETWVNANHARSRCWQYRVLDKDGNVVGYKGSMNIKSGAGKRLILNHFITEDGFVEGARDLFLGETGSGDYHKEMNSVHYIEHLKQFAHNLPDKCLMTLDKASYHMTIKDQTRNPRKAWTKDVIIDWLLQHGDEADAADLSAMTKEQLLCRAPGLGIVEEHEIDALLKRIPKSDGNGLKDIVVLRLPTKHCFFNPIELIWAWVKGFVAAHNSSCKLEDVRKLTEEALDKVPGDLFSKCFTHTEKEIEKYARSDTFVSVQVDPVVINTADDTTSESDGSDEESDSVLPEEDDGIVLSPSDEQLQITELSWMDRSDADMDEDERAQLQYYMHLTARENRTPHMKVGCSCVTSKCATRMCACRKGDRKCQPTCNCVDCTNMYKPPEGFIPAKVIVQPRDVDADSSPRTPKTPRTSRRVGGPCKCTTNCRKRTCVCIAANTPCTSSCRCNYCMNTGYQDRGSVLMFTFRDIMCTM